LVLALVALLAGVAVVSQSTFFAFGTKQTLEEQLTRALQECRYRALQGQPRVSLAYSSPAGFAVCVQGEAVQVFPIAHPETLSELSFQQLLPSEKSSGQQSESVAVERIPFDPNGLPFPFAVTCKTGAQRKTLSVDPLSGALFED